MQTPKKLASIVEFFSILSLEDFSLCSKEIHTRAFIWNPIFMQIWYDRLNGVTGRRISDWLFLLRLGGAVTSGLNAFDMSAKETKP